MNPVKVVFTGDGEPVEPGWHLLYSSRDECEIAHEQWRQVIGEMKSAQILTHANGHAIRRLICFRVEYERAVRHVAQEGAVIKSVGGGVDRPNPWWSVLRQSDETVRRLEAELGISPLRRAKVGKVTKRDAGGRASTYLSKKRAV